MNRADISTATLQLAKTWDGLAGCLRQFGGRITRATVAHVGLLLLRSEAKGFPVKMTENLGAVGFRISLRRNPCRLPFRVSLTRNSGGCGNWLNLSRFGRRSERTHKSR